MKNLFSIVLIVFVASSAMAQKGKLRMAKSYMENGDYKAAYSAINDASEHDKTKDLPETWVVKAQVLSGIKASPELSQIMGIEVSDDDLIASIERAKELDRSGSYGDEIEAAATVMVQNAHNEGVAAYSEAKDYKKAIAAFETEIEFREKYAPGLGIDTIDYYVIGASAYELGDKDKAIEAYNKLVELNFQELAVYYTLLQIYQETEQDENYLGLIETAAARFPEENNFTLMKIDYYLSQGQIDTILDEMIAEVEKNPGNVNLLLAISSAYEGKEDYTNQYKYASKAAELAPDNYNAVFNAGVAKFNDAVKYNTDMNFMSSKTSPEYLAAKEKRDALATEAKVYFDQAYAISPSSKSVLTAYVQFYRMQNDKDKEAEFQQKLDSAQ